MIVTNNRLNGEMLQMLDISTNQPVALKELHDGMIVAISSKLASG
jgi:hypothetical protein